MAAKFDHLSAMGVKFIYNIRVGRDVQVDELLEQYDAVFLGIGAPIGHAIKLPGEDLQGIYQPTEFIVRGNLPLEDLPEGLRSLPEIGQSIAVIGGGDTSADCVRTARRLQVQHGLASGSVVDYYRGAEAEMRVREEEYIHAKEEGVHYEFLASPVRFIGDEQGHVRQIEMQRMMSRPVEPAGAAHALHRAHPGAGGEFHRPGRYRGAGDRLRRRPADPDPDARPEDDQARHFRSRNGSHRAHDAGGRLRRRRRRARRRPDRHRHRRRAARGAGDG